MTKRKLFLGYCAFSPYIQFFLCLVLMSWWDLSPNFLIMLLLTIPFTCCLACASIINGKSDGLGLVSSTLGTLSHVLFYMYVSAVFVFNHDPIPADTFVLVLMVCLMSSSISLLLNFDNFLTSA